MRLDVPFSILRVSCFYDLNVYALMMYNDVDCQLSRMCQFQYKSSGIAEGNQSQLRCEERDSASIPSEVDTLCTH